MNEFTPLRCLSDIPNQVGFRLDGLDKATGKRVPLVVAKTPGGCHYLETLNRTPRPITEFSGWYPAK